MGPAVPRGKGGQQPCDKRHPMGGARPWAGGRGRSPRLGLGKLSCRRKTTFSTKCWISHCSGPRTNTIQSCVKPSVVGFLRSWARCPSSSFTWTVHWWEEERGRGSVRSPAQGAPAAPPPRAQSTVNAGTVNTNTEQARGLADHGQSMTSFQELPAARALCTCFPCLRSPACPGQAPRPLPTLRLGLPFLPQPQVLCPTAWSFSY